MNEIDNSGILPLVHRIYPMKIPMCYDDIEYLRGCDFLSKTRLKRLLKTWKPSFNGRRIAVHVVEYENSKPISKKTKVFVFPESNDDFIVELANLSDLHGIIKMSNGSIWLREVNDPMKLNIDATIMGRISNRLQTSKILEKEKMDKMEKMQMKIMCNSL